MTFSLVYLPRSDAYRIDIRTASAHAHIPFVSTIAASADGGLSPADAVLGLVEAGDSCSTRDSTRYASAPSWAQMCAYPPAGLDFGAWRWASAGSRTTNLTRTFTLAELLACHAAGNASAHTVQPAVLESGKRVYRGGFHVHLFACVDAHRYEQGLVVVHADYMEFEIMQDAHDSVVVHVPSGLGLQPYQEPPYAAANVSTPYLPDGTLDANRDAELADAAARAQTVHNAAYGFAVEIVSTQFTGVGGEMQLVFSTTIDNAANSAATRLDDPVVTAYSGAVPALHFVGASTRCLSYETGACVQFWMLESTGAPGAVHGTADVSFRANHAPGAPGAPQPGPRFCSARLQIELAYTSLVVESGTHAAPAGASSAGGVGGDSAMDDAVYAELALYQQLPPTLVVRNRYASRELALQTAVPAAAATEPTTRYVYPDEVDAGTVVYAHLRLNTLLAHTHPVIEMLVACVLPGAAQSDTYFSEVSRPLASGCYSPDVDAALRSVVFNRTADTQHAATSAAAVAENVLRFAPQPVTNASAVSQLYFHVVYSTYYQRHRSARSLRTDHAALARGDLRAVSDRMKLRCRDYTVLASGEVVCAQKAPAAHHTVAQAAPAADTQEGWSWWWILVVCGALILFVVVVVVARRRKREKNRLLAYKSV